MVAKLSLSDFFFFISSRRNPLKSCVHARCYLSLRTVENVVSLTRLL